MKTKFLALTLGTIIILFFSCSENEISLNVEEVLIGNTWIMESYSKSDKSDTFIEYTNKNEYTFYDNGRYKMKRFQRSYDVYYHEIIDTMIQESDWYFDEENNMVNFSDIELMLIQSNWEVLDFTNKKLIVKPILPLMDWTSEVEKILILKKN